MIKTFLFVPFLFSMCAAWAQVKEGKVVYERTVQFGMRTGGANAPAGNGPRSRTDRFELLFTAGKQLWQELPDMSEAADNLGGDGGMVRMRFGADELIYTHLETGVAVSKQELASKNYVVTDIVRRLAWKLAGNTKELLGMKAQKATATRIGTRMMMAMENGEMKRTAMADTTAITAWFTPEVPVAAGPEWSGQLPGLLLELELNRGRTVYKAVELTPKVNTAAIKEPKGGKAITAAEFAQERDRVFEAMRRNGPPGRRMQTTAN